MRRVTQQEGESWPGLAQQHGFGSGEGRFVLGRFIVEGRDENGLVLFFDGVTAEFPEAELRRIAVHHPVFKIQDLQIRRST
jgi:hypothetical protein